MSSQFKLDYYLEAYDYAERHSSAVPGAPDSELFRLVRHLDFSSSWLIRALFILRGLGTRHLNIDAMVAGDEFALLEEIPGREIVIGGMAGARMKPVPVQSGEHFRDFAEHNGIKIAWNFYLSPDEAGGTIVSTETRVSCLGPKMKRWFSRYWFFIRPFSGLVRLEMLRILRRQTIAMRAVR
jgi:hypothetical protein